MAYGMPRVPVLGLFWHAASRIGQTLKNTAECATILQMWKQQPKF